MHGEKMTGRREADYINRIYKYIGYTIEPWLMNTLAMNRTT